MKRFFLAVACVAGLAPAGGSASAGGPVQGVVTGSCSTCGSPSASGSLFSRLAWWKSGSCSTCGHGSNLRSWTNNGAGKPYAGSHHGAAPHVPYPQGTPGTLVFPQHPFVRSPRDFFMTER